MAAENLQSDTVGLFFSCFLFQIGSDFLAQTDHELAILLPLHPKCWDHRYAPPSPAQSKVS
jgi:hypothetical protein